LVHITSFDKDYYHFDPAKHRLVGERSNKVYRLADKVRVRVARVDLERKRIDFELAGSDEGEKSSAPESERHASKKSKNTKKRRRPRNRSKSAKKGSDTAGASAPASDEAAAPVAAKKKKRSRRRRK